MRSWILIAGLLCPMTFLTGCSSFATTFFRRSQDNTLCKENSKPIHGVPVMVRVPTHLELRVDETIHLVRRKQTTNIEALTPNGASLRSVDANLRFTEKMFVLDPKRPMSGPASYGFTFRSKPAANSNAARDAAKDSAGHGYLQGLKYKVDDQTITNASAFLANIAPLLASPVGFNPNSPSDSLDGVYTTGRTVAFGVFDLASPSFEEDINHFLDLHLNHCRPCVENESIHTSKDAPPPADESLGS